MLGGMMYNGVCVPAILSDNVDDVHSLFTLWVRASGHKDDVEIWQGIVATLAVFFYCKISVSVDIWCGQIWWRLALFECFLVLYE